MNARLRPSASAKPVSMAIRSSFSPPSSTRGRAASTRNRSTALAGVHPAPPGTRGRTGGGSSRRSRPWDVLSVFAWWTLTYAGGPLVGAAILLLAFPATHRPGVPGRRDQPDIPCAAAEVLRNRHGKGTLGTQPTVRRAATKTDKQASAGHGTPGNGRRRGAEGRSALGYTRSRAAAAIDGQSITC